ncbi:uncharacterized protein Dyak_GE28987, isoform A [Drosophila yakuba]|uniref:Uncharacterized protein, isoform A n=1 Tax=Drosophila yakuba TaxID=7245 RepID=A0A0R1E5J9_DROYA|nr:uncharacterized protein Dyak_GE28987, isoform A [Drosophila yakuba]
MNLIFLAKISKLQWSTWLILRIPFGHAAGCSNSKAQKDFQCTVTAQESRGTMQGGNSSSSNGNNGRTNAASDNGNGSCLQA